MEFSITSSGDNVIIEQGKFRAQASLAWGSQLVNPISDNNKPVMPRCIVEVKYDDVKSVYEMKIEYENGAVQVFCGADLRVFPEMEGMQILSDESELVRFKP